MADYHFTEGADFLAFIRERGTLKGDGYVIPKADIDAVYAIKEAICANGGGFDYLYNESGRKIGSSRCIYKNYAENYLGVDVEMIERSHSKNIFVLIGD